MSIRSTLRIRTRLRSFVHRFSPPEPKPLILMYHKIAEDPVDPWRLSVSAAHFMEHLQILRRTRQPLPLEEFVRLFREGTLPAKAVAVTFDDGYLDNLEAGRPLLESADVPATVFVTTGYLNRREQVWSDELATLVLVGTGPKYVDIAIGRHSLRVELGAQPFTRKDGSIHGLAAMRRTAALTKISEVLRRLTEKDRQPIMADLRLKLKVSNYPTKPCRTMTTDELLQLSDGGLITIGAHTVTHPVLTELDSVRCYREIKESKDVCEALVGKCVNSFAYPYGKFDAKSRAAVESAGFSYACATREEPVLPSSDLFCLPRLHVSNKNGDAFQQALHLASILRPR
jgi:peptidoglycan/xylan/chitin deacetylase (PgdA/CDA1 family)